MGIYVPDIGWVILTYQCPLQPFFFQNVIQWVPLPSPLSRLLLLQSKFPRFYFFFLLYPFWEDCNINFPSPISNLLFSPRLPTFGLKNSSYNSRSRSDGKSPPGPAFASDWGSGISSNTYDQQTFNGAYSANEHPMQKPDDYKIKRYPSPTSGYPSPTSGVALNIIQYHKDNFVRSEDHMIGNIPRRADSQSSHI